MANASPQETPIQPRYRGLSGALCCGLSMASLLLIGLFVGLGGIRLMVGARGFPSFIWLRLFCFGLGTGLAVATGRFLCGGATNRLFRTGIGDGAGFAGSLAGVIFAGYIAQTQLPKANSPEKGFIVGQPVEIAGPTLEGGHFDLASLRGKVVLVDCWASWCGPCIAELPNVHEAYENYHAQGLEAVGVSFDFERANLEKFLKSNPSPWPQIYFEGEDEKAFKNPIAQRYDINGIPHILVVDRQGNVAADNVRGAQVATAVADALELPVAWSDRLMAAVSYLTIWFFRGFLESPVWLLFASLLGGAFVVGLADAAIRRLLAERVSGA